MKTTRVLSLLLSATIAVAAVWFYYWTVGSPRVFAGRQTDYYNLLVEGFQAGQLAMNVTPDPWLGVDNSKVTHYLLDASFYQGKYYLYFGVTPAVLLMWPWTAITGHDLPEGVTVALLAMLALGMSLGWLRTLQRHFLPEPPLWFWPLAVLMLGFGTGYPVVLRRPLFYEIAIFSGVACSMGGLWALSLAVLRREQAVRWLACGSLCAGLAAGSRPTLTPGAVLAVALAAGLILWAESRHQPGWPVRRAVRLGLAAVVPAALCGAALAWYNWARFGNPLDFGLLHQVGSNGGGFSFTFRSLWSNLGLYYFTAPSFSWLFPFFGVGANPPGIYREQVHGQLFALPLLALAAGFGVSSLWRARGVAGVLRPELGVAVVAAAWSGITLLVDCMAPPHANRYQLDFHPVFVVGMLLLLGAAGRQQAWRWPVRVAIAWCGVVAVFNVCTSFSVHGFFRIAHPDQFERIARVADRLVWPLHRLVGAQLGGFEVVVRFPEGKPGTAEPLVVTGGGHDMDALLVKYTAPGRGKLAFVHLEHGEVEGEEFDLQPGRARWLEIHLGSLYPPAWHPWYESLPQNMARAVNRVSVKVDGVNVLDRDVVCFQATANQMRLGERGGFPIREEKFSGEISRVRGLKADLNWLQAVKQRSGVLRLRLLLPRDRFGTTEPLVLTGERGRTDFLRITYSRPDAVRFSFIHEGAEPLVSPEVEWDYLQPLELLVDLGSLRSKEAITAGQADGVTVEIDGQVVLAKELETYPARPTQVYIGCAPWHMSGSRSMFGGQVLPAPSADIDPAPVRRAKRSLLHGRTVELRVSFPGKTANLPLLTTGAPGIGDGLFVEYLSDTEVRFGFDHWGSAATYSEPMRVEPGRIYRLDVSFGARLSDKVAVPGHLRVQLDGRTVFDQPFEFFPADASRIFFGANPIGLSTSGPRFTGMLALPGQEPQVTSP